MHLPLFLQHIRYNIFTKIQIFVHKKVMYVLMDFKILNVPIYSRQKIDLYTFPFFSNESFNLGFTNSIYFELLEQ